METGYRERIIRERESERDSVAVLSGRDWTEEVELQCGCPHRLPPPTPPKCLAFGYQLFLVISLYKFCMIKVHSFSCQPWQIVHQSVVLITANYEPSSYNMVNMNFPLTINLFPAAVWTA